MYMAVQERLTTQIAATLFDLLKPKGVIVVAEAACVAYFSPWLAFCL